MGSLFTIKKYNNKLFYIKCEKTWDKLSYMDRDVMIEIGTSKYHEEKLKQYNGYRQTLNVPKENIKDGYMTCFENKNDAERFLEEYYIPKFIELKLINSNDCEE